MIILSFFIRSSYFIFYPNSWESFLCPSLSHILIIYLAGFPLKFICSLFLLFQKLFFLLPFSLKIFEDNLLILYLWLPKAILCPLPPLKYVDDPRRNITLKIICIKEIKIMFFFCIHSSIFLFFSLSLLCIYLTVYFSFSLRLSHSIIHLPPSATFRSLSSLNLHLYINNLYLALSLSVCLSPSLPALQMRGAGVQRRLHH